MKKKTQLKSPVRRGNLTIHKKRGERTTFFKHAAKPASIDHIRAAFGLKKHDVTFAKNLSKVILAHV